MADADKDRRSRMAISTVHAPPKKGGAGGAFTWGSATDTSIDFDVPQLNSHLCLLACNLPSSIQDGSFPYFSI